MLAVLRACPLRARLFKAPGPGGVISGQRETLLKSSFGTTFLTFSRHVCVSSFTNTWSISTSSGIFDTYATRAFQRAVSRLQTLKTLEVRDLSRFLAEGGPPLCQRITPPGPGALNLKKGLKSWFFGFWPCGYRVESVGATWEVHSMNVPNSTYFDKSLCLFMNFESWEAGVPEMERSRCAWSIFLTESKNIH